MRRVIKSGPRSPFTLGRIVGQPKPYWPWKMQGYMLYIVKGRDGYYVAQNASKYRKLPATWQMINVGEDNG